MSTEQTRIRLFTTEDTDTVIRLWERCELVKPWNDPRKDIQRKLDDSPDLFYVMTHTPSSGDDSAATGGIVGAAMAGYEGHRGWVNYLAIDPELRKSGLGRLLMQHIEDELLKRGCPKINLQVRETNVDVLAFYQAIGYQVDAAVSLGKRLIPDN